MKILIIDNGSRYLDKLKLLVSGHDFHVTNYSQIAPTGYSSYDLIILSGGHTISVMGHDFEFAKEIELIQNSPTPILGICLGFELVSHSYGATLHKMISKEKSIIQIKLLNPDPLFENLSQLNVFESHRWVIDNAGDNLLPLAASLDGIEIIRHRHKLIYGFQFHPEMFTEVTQGDELFANFLKIVDNSHI